MKFKKICISTCLSDLYGMNKYQSHINVGREYWYYFPINSDIYKKTNKNWNKITVTYIRSGVFFYTFNDAQELDECYCPVNCFMASRLVFADLYPNIDLADQGFNEDLYCFDDELTIVKNWDNCKEVELYEEDGYLFATASVLCEKMGE